MLAKPKTARKTRGRPPLPPEAGKRFPLNMRTTKKIRDELQAAAHASGRSLAQEVEHRLEQSFRDEKNRYREFRNKKTYNLMQSLAVALQASEKLTLKSWGTDPKTFSLALEYLKILQAIPPITTLDSVTLSEYVRREEFVNREEFVRRVGARLSNISEGKHK